MRMGFGLVSLLVTVAIILYLMVGGGGTGGPGYLQQVAKTNKQLKGQVNVISGYDPGRQVLATDSIHYHIDRSAGRPRLMVTEVMAGGPMEERFGLRPGDRVIELGALDVTMNISNFDDATAAFHDAYARGGTIVVMRDGKQLTLPDADHLARIAERDRQAALAAAASAGTPPPTASAAPADDRDAVGRALDAVRSPAR